MISIVKKHAKEPTRAVVPWNPSSKRASGVPVGVARSRSRSAGLAFWSDMTNPFRDNIGHPDRAKLMQSIVQVIRTTD